MTNQKQMPELTDNERGAWRTAITLAHNLCAQISDRFNDDDAVVEAHAALDCGLRIRPYLDAPDHEILEMMEEAGMVRADLAKPALDVEGLRPEIEEASDKVVDTILALGGAVPEDVAQHVRTVVRCELRRILTEHAKGGES